jgi:uncharacterized membrane protein
VAKPSSKVGNPPKEPLNEDDLFASEIAKRVSAVVGRDKASQVTAQVVSLFSERFSGPIAHPRHLREYDEIVPGAADRIISMAEDALIHQKKMEEIALQATINDVKDGRRFGFAALVLLIVSALVCGIYGYQILAGAFLGAGALGTIGAFINGKVQKNS